MLVKKLIPAIALGLMAFMPMSSHAADTSVWSDVENVRMMKSNMAMMKDAMAMMKKAEETKDMEMAKKAVKMMKTYVFEYEKIFGTN